MRLIIIRHAEPDYENDTITEKGRREAQLLADHIKDMKVDKVYVSPLGRARATAEPYLEKSGKDATVINWLEEFPSRIVRPDDESRKNIVWDWLPQDWTKEDEFYDVNKWTDNDRLIAGGVREKYEEIRDGFDSLLAGCGYVRKNRLYMVERPNTDTIMFFCHFGMECVMLGRLFNISPMILWHSVCAAPASITTVVTEERRKGIASFRMLSFGDTSYLREAGEETSFHARFCEIYDNMDERHD